LESIPQTFDVEVTKLSLLIFYSDYAQAKTEEKRTKAEELLRILPQRSTNAVSVYFMLEDYYNRVFLPE
jgi:hypothetical protein